MDDEKLFGWLILEINQAGLSWTTIVKKQANFRAAHAGYDFAAIARFGEADRARLFSDAGINRNRLKVEAVIHNAARVLEPQAEYGPFKAWLDANHPVNRHEWVKLFHKTFRFTGGEITNGFLLSTGHLRSAHVETCPIFTRIVVLGVLVVRERLTRLKLVAGEHATLGVLVITVSYARLPWITIALGSSFGLYGFVKKTSCLNSLVSLLVELIVLFPIAAGKPGVSWLLAAAGVATIAPLLLFGAAPRRIPLSRVGPLQYVAPTLMLVIGTLFYGEPFTAVHAVSFAFIWSALPPCSK